MIKSVEILGFKSLAKQTMPLGSVTLLCGLNNSGKSSVLQAIRMYCNSADGKDPLLPGHGSVDELRSKFVLPTDPIKVTCVFEENKSDALTLNPSEYESPQRSPFTIFLSADRLGPRTSLPLFEGFKKYPSIGEHGEYVIGFLDALRDSKVPKILHHQKSQGETLEYQVAAWLTEIAPGTNLFFEIDRKIDSSRVEFNSFRPTNTGFGLSYSLPIIAALLGAATEKNEKGWGDSWDEHWDTARQTRGVLLLIENPEAHLHPSAQTALGRLISLSASAGIQIIVETQSEHIMDGVRLSVKRNEIDHNSVVFNYLSRSKDGVSELLTPIVAADGKLSFWPEGFFDQALKNRIQIAKAT
jgi:predicted ATPase